MMDFCRIKLSVLHTIWVWNSIVQWTMDTYKVYSYNDDRTHSFMKTKIINLEDINWKLFKLSYTISINCLNLILNEKKSYIVINHFKLDPYDQKIEFCRQHNLIQSYQWQNTGLPRFQNNIYRLCNQYGMS